MEKPADIVAQQGFTICNATNRFIAPHGHQYLEFAYVQQGVMEHHIQGQTYLLQPGDFFIVDYGVTHAYQRVSEEKLLVRNFLFIPAFLDRSLVGSMSFQDVMNSYLLRFCSRTLRTSPTGITFHDTDGRIQALLDEISQEYKNREYGYMELIRSTFVKVLILTLRNIGKDEETPHTSQVCARMRRYAEAHYQKKLKLKALAEEMGYSDAYLSQKFHQEMGIPFTEYIHRLRVEKSCHLLETTDYKVSRIAEEVGYDGVKFFNQIFKAHLSITPREYRTRSRSTTVVKDALP